MEAQATIHTEVPSEKGNSFRTSKLVLYVGIFSIVMLFAGLSSAYLVSSYGELWVNLTLPSSFFVSTVVILLSSLVIKLAVDAAQAGNRGKAMGLLIVTIVLGLTFSYFQYQGWQELIGKGSYLSGHVDNLNGVYGEDYTITYQGRELVMEDGAYYFDNDNLREKPLNDEIAIYNNSASSYIYLLSFVHLLHVLGGLLFLIGLFISAQFRKDGLLNAKRWKLGSIYWHFVDGLWVYLFLFLLLIH